MKRVMPPSFQKLPASKQGLLGEPSQSLQRLSKNQKNFLLGRVSEINGGMVCFAETTNGGRSVVQTQDRAKKKSPRGVATQKQTSSFNQGGGCWQGRRSGGGYARSPKKPKREMRGRKKPDFLSEGEKGERTTGRKRRVGQETHWEKGGGKRRGEDNGRIHRRDCLRFRRRTPGEMEKIS